MNLAIDADRMEDFRQALHPDECEREQLFTDGPEALNLEFAGSGVYVVPMVDRVAHPKVRPADPDDYLLGVLEEPMRHYLNTVAPQGVADVALALSLFRLGLAQSGFSASILAARSGDGPLGPWGKRGSYGHLVFREDILSAIREYTASSRRSAVLFLCVLQRRREDQVIRLREQLLETARANGCDVKRAIRLMDYLPFVAGYAFSKAHATGLALMITQGCELERRFAILSHSAWSPGSAPDWAWSLVETARRLGPKS